jgi:uncharacterized protein YkwD
MSCCAPAISRRAEMPGAMRATRLLGLLFLLLPIAASGGTPADERPSVSLREKLLGEVNAERLSHGRAALRPDPALNEAAQQRAEQIASGEEDEDPDKDLANRLARAGYRPRRVSEVILESDEGGNHLMADWRASSTYKDLLSGEYRDAGLGLLEEDDVLLTVFLFALSARDFFDEKSAGLKDLERARRQMLERVNRERREARLPRLSAASRLDRAAQAHADDMARRSYYSHESLEGKIVSHRVSAQGYSFLASAENIASGQFSVEEVMEAWMKSRAHRANILHSLFTEAGFGLSLGELDGVPTVFWVQVFARPKA